jgi:Ca2+-binding EF-hand superfamily protein
MMDDSRDRRLDIHEFINGCRGRGIHKMTDAELKEVFSRFDKDGGGTIDFEEFLRAIRVRTRNTSFSVL